MPRQCSSVCGPSCPSSPRSRSRHFLPRHNRVSKVARGLYQAVKMGQSGESCLCAWQVLALSGYVPNLHPQPLAVQHAVSFLFIILPCAAPQHVDRDPVDCRNLLTAAGAKGLTIPTRRSAWLGSSSCCASRSRAERMSKSLPRRLQKAAGTAIVTAASASGQALAHVLARFMIFRGAQVLALEAHAAGESAIDPLTRR